jgi:hypothetical protein
MEKQNHMYQFFPPKFSRQIILEMWQKLGASFLKSNLVSNSKLSKRHYKNSFLSTFVCGTK